MQFIRQKDLFSPSKTLIMLPSLNAKHTDPLKQRVPYGYSWQNISLEPCCNSEKLHGDGCSEGVRSWKDMCERCCSDCAGSQAPSLQEGRGLRGRSKPHGSLLSSDMIVLRRAAGAALEFSRCIEPCRNACWWKQHTCTHASCPTLLSYWIINAALAKNRCHLSGTEGWHVLTFLSIHSPCIAAKKSADQLCSIASAAAGPGTGPSVTALRGSPCPAPWRALWGLFRSLFPHYSW